MEMVTRGGYEIAELERDEFLDEYWNYQAGEHVTVLGPTQSGKTTLAFQMLHKVTPKTDTYPLPKDYIQGVVLVMKPRDEVPEAEMKKLQYKKVTSWPPASSTRWHPRQPPGWVVWPKLGNIETDDAKLTRVFDTVYKTLYAETAKKKARPKIIFCDEIVGITKELGLERRVKAVFMRGSSMGLGQWSASQRPFEVPLLAYNSPTHLFIHRDDDKRNRDRYREIGGIDKDMIESVMREMELHEFLYFNRKERSVSIITA